MTDELEERFRSLDVLHFPHADRPPDAGQGVARDHIDIQPALGRRVAIALFALAVGAAGVAFAMRAFRPTPEEGTPANVRGATTIVFAAFDGEDWTLYRANPDGSSETEIPGNLPDDAFHPSLSPDGTTIAFDAGPEKDKDIYSVALDGAGLAQLTTSQGWDYQPAWSPGDDRIAYVRSTGQNNDIWVMSADGSNPVRLTTDPSFDLQPTWSPDGTRIAFQSNRSGNPEDLSHERRRLGSVEAESPRRVRRLTGLVPGWDDDRVRERSGRSRCVLDGCLGRRHPQARRCPTGRAARP